MITIYASELSACVGMNKYRSVIDVARKVWCRSDPEGYRRALVRNGTSDPEPVKDILDSLQLTERFSEIVLEKTPENVQNRIENMSNEHKMELDFKGVLLSDVTSFVHTERGKLHENISIERIEKTLDVAIKDRNDKFYKRYIDITDNDGGKYVIGGKVDGITENGYLVEVKNRQYRFFSYIPIYEKVQIHAYMFLTGIDKCKFVQSYNGEDKTEDISFDYKFWNNVKEECSRFVKAIMVLMTDDEAQDDLFSTGKMPDIYNKESLMDDKEKRDI